MAALATGFFAIASGAQAATFLLTYTHSGYDIYATIGATPDGPGEYLATSATGTIGGPSLMLGAVGSCCGSPSSDNILYTSRGLRHAGDLHRAGCLEKHIGIFRVLLALPIIYLERRLAFILCTAQRAHAEDAVVACTDRP
jgi:hypothetical protein